MRQLATCLPYSLSVKAMAALWQVPLLRVDIGALFTSALGGTEERLRQVLKLADSLGRCCMWVDEGVPGSKCVQCGKEAWLSC